MLGSNGSSIYCAGCTPDGTKATINPTAVTAKVGEYKTVELDIYTSDGRLWSGAPNLGYYANATNSIKIFKADNSTPYAPDDYSISNGPKKGTYLVTLRSKEAFPNGTNLNFQF